MRVLVVEDDKALGGFLRQGLELEGHEVQWVEDGDEALLTVANTSPELIVLDLSLPRRDGTEVLSELRARQYDSSVLVLTGRNDLNARVHCLDIGADDCLLKPFSYYELMARCRALLRRRRQTADPVLRHGDVELHRIERRVARAGRAIELTQKEFALLEYLMLNKGECVSRGRLLADVWHMPTETGTNVVDVYVNYLRKKLDCEGDGAAPLIETVRGAGYRLGGPERMSDRKPPARAISPRPEAMAAPA
jgi:DNA-binding response OmpR family regulator